GIRDKLVTGVQTCALPIFAVRLTDDGFLANGASLDWPSSRHQRLVLRTLESSKSPFGVVPFDSITAVWTDGEVRDWNQAPFSIRSEERRVGKGWEDATAGG